ncbi:MAG: hypothetical protein MK220_03880 [Candidatus Poseidoniia archaeon]|nr:hypothetical protein [Candidatus Poseidoniia archaeon]
MREHLEPLPEETLTFSGEGHRLFIGGRGFDFQSLEVRPDGTMELDLQNPDPELTRLLGEGEPRVIYVVSREGVRDLVLQGCQLESRTIACHLKYRR